MMIVGIAADHGGFALKTQLVKSLGESGFRIRDFGAHELNLGDDYPDVIIPLARAVAAGEVERGIALCGSGVGASIAANKIAGVRAGLIHDIFSAHQGVEDDDMNVICLGGYVIGAGLATELIHKFLRVRFSGAQRHRRRLAKVAALEPDADPIGFAGAGRRAQRFPEYAEATAGGRRETFTLDWYLRRWSSPLDHNMADFPFVAEIAGKRYELFGDRTFNEEEVSRYAVPASTGAAASP